MKEEQDKEKIKDNEEEKMIKKLERHLTDEVGNEQQIAEITLTDKLGRNAFHRCALEHNPTILKFLINKLERNFNDKSPE